MRTVAVMSMKSRLRAWLEGVERIDVRGAMFPSDVTGRWPASLQHAAKDIFHRRDIHQDRADPILRRARPRHVGLQKDMPSQPAAAPCVGAQNNEPATWFAGDTIERSWDFPT